MRLLGFALLLLPVLAAGCTVDGDSPTGLQSFSVVITQVNGREPPPVDAPLPANRGDVNEVWTFTIEARNARGTLEPVDGLVRLSTKPGTVLSVAGDGAEGRNIMLHAGKASGLATVTAVYGDARLWVEDLGYQPAAEGATPSCADGIDDDYDNLIDFPADPGCAFADDDSEEGGSFAVGVSQAIAYSRPRIFDIQGGGTTTPYPFEAIQVETRSPAHLVVTRLSKDGFYVTDLNNATAGYNNIFAFNFSSPAFMRVCDRVDYLAGTVNEFFGFTELSFPSYKLDYPFEGEECEVPEPTVLTKDQISSPLAMEALESGLVRVQGVTVGKYFGPAPAIDNVFADGQSSCDLNGDGQVDFLSDAEGSCSDACSDNPDCVEWTAFSARGSFKVHDDVGTMILVQTGSADFDPVAYRGKVLDSVTGTLRNFSGGSLNWTIETRCVDDLVCDAVGCCPEDRCPQNKPLTSKEACVDLRSLDDNDVISD